MEIGKCHLCGKIKELKKSHIWPQFAYKRFASNPAKGGQFADLTKQQLNNEQYTSFWFCHECEQILGKTEDYAARLCSKIEADPKKDHAYDERLLRFAVSISWRTLKYHTPGTHNRAVENKWEAAGIWKRYLRMSAPRIKSYTQHIFNVIDNPFGLEKMLGGALVREQSLVLSQIGPLLIVGHLKPQDLSAEEQITWRNSKVLSTGGSISPIREWKTGTKDPAANNITIRFTALLKSHELNVIDLASSGNWTGRARK